MQGSRNIDILMHIRDYCAEINHTKATMWLWSLKDLAIVGIIILFSVFAFAYAGVWFPLVIAGAYYHR